MNLGHFGAECVWCVVCGVWLGILGAVYFFCQPVGGSALVKDREFCTSMSYYLVLVAMKATAQFKFFVCI